MNRFLRFSCFFACLLSGLPAFTQSDVAQLALKVDDHYDHMHSLKAQFTESYAGEGMSRTESGTLWLKEPGKMRWDYANPRQKLFISDGKTAWFYVPGEQQARKAPVNKIDDIRSPLRFLLGKTKLQKELTRLHIASEKPEIAGDLALSGVPKGMEDRISQVTLEVTPEGRIDRITIEEVDGARTDFKFSDEAENGAVADKLFTFKPPQGVELIDAAELGN